MQASPLPPWAVALFELAAVFARDASMKVTAGYICMLAHGRLRNSDGRAIVAARSEDVYDISGVLSGGQMAAEAVHVKTSNTKEKKTMLLPIAAWLLGLTGGHWFLGFMEGRREMGLEEMDRDPENILRGEETRVPIFPTGTSRGSPGSTGAKADETTSALRQLCRALGILHLMPKHTSSHSCKYVWLSIAAILGVDPVTQAILGYHVPPGHDSLMLYARRNLAAPMRKLIEVRDGLIDGHIRPDAQKGNEIISDPALRDDIHKQLIDVTGKSFSEWIEVLEGSEAVREDWHTAEDDEVVIRAIADGAVDDDELEEAEEEALEEAA